MAKFPSFKDDEVNINLAAPIRLCALYTPPLLRRKKAAIVNISSGLAFVPMAMTPVYCATKAAIHSFTISLRHQLRETSVRVFEAAHRRPILNLIEASPVNRSRHTEELAHRR